MFLKYFKVSFKDQVRKKSFLIILFLFLILSFSSAIINSVNSSSLFFFENIKFDPIFYLNFLLTSIITFVLSIHIFVNSKKEGYENVLIIQNSRIKIYIYKFIYLLLFISSLIIIQNFISLPFYLINGAIKQNQFWQYFISNIFGAILIQIFMISISFLFINVFKNIVSYSSYILLIVVIPLLSSIMQTSLNAAPANINEFNRPMYEYNIKTKEIDKNKDYYNYLYTGLENDFNEYTEKERYETYSYFDLFYYASRANQIFRSDKVKNSSQVKKWTTKVENVNLNYFLPAGPTTQRISLVLTENDYKYDFKTKKEIDFQDSVDTSRRNVISFFDKFGSEKMPNSTISFFEAFNDANILNRMSFIQYFLRGVKRETDQEKMALKNSLEEISKGRINVLNTIEPLTFATYSEILNSSFVNYDFANPKKIDDWDTNQIALINNYLLSDSEDVLNLNVVIFESKNYVSWYIMILMFIALLSVVNFLGLWGYKWKEI